MGEKNEETLKRLVDKCVEYKDEIGKLKKRLDTLERDNMILKGELEAIKSMQIEKSVHGRGYGDDDYHEYLFEYERYIHLAGWNKPTIPTDPPHWASLGDKPAKSPDKFTDPPTLGEIEYAWTGPWEIEGAKQGRQVDEEGWEYSKTFLMATWHDKQRPLDYMRRRLWRRAKIPKKDLRPSWFGCDLESIMKYQSEKYPDAQLPIIVPVLCQAVRDLGGMRAEGIFRLSVSADQLEKTKAALDNDHNIGDCTSPYVAAALLKQWLRSLKDPLIPAPLYDRAIALGSQDVIPGPDVLAVFGDMPPLNRAILEHIAVLVGEISVESNAAVNKMSVRNLAIVFSPGLLRSPSEDPMVILHHAGKLNTFAEALLNALIEKNGPPVVSSPTEKKVIPKPTPPPRPANLPRSGSMDKIGGSNLFMALTGGGPQTLISPKTPVIDPSKSPQQSPQQQSAQQSPQQQSAQPSQQQSAQPSQQQSAQPPPQQSLQQLPPQSQTQQKSQQPSPQQQTQTLQQRPAAKEQPAMSATERAVAFLGRAAPSRDEPRQRRARSMETKKDRK